MKNFKKILLLLGMVTILVSCNEEDKYSGTPVGNQAIETIHATVELIDPSQTSYLTNQKIPFRVILPRTFADTVTVEATTLNKSGGRTRVSVDIMPGQTTSNAENIAGKDPEIPAAGGAIFNTEMELFLSGIALKTVEPGKHYLLDSNRITLYTGNTTVPTDDINRLQIKFSWYNPSATRNNLRVFVDRPNANTYESPVNSVSVTGSGASQVVTVFVNSTAGLQKGMAVQVSSGVGAFPNGTIVTSVGVNSFTVSQAPTAANALGATAVVTAGGIEYSSQYVSNTTTTINVTSTTGLYPGMVLSVISGSGSFPRGAVVSSVDPNGTTFKSSGSPTGLNATSVIGASYPDVFPIFSGGSILHDITNLPGQIAGGVSSASGEYIFKLLPQNVIQDGLDIPYRIVWKQPDGTARSYDGVFTAASLTSPALPVLKVVKAGSGTTATYTVTPL